MPVNPDEIVQTLLTRWSARLEKNKADLTEKEVAYREGGIRALEAALFLIRR